MRSWGLCVFCVVALVACRGGCRKNDEHHRAIVAAGSNAIDCPPGLARCEGGSVWASAQRTVARDCTSPETCVCPWTHVGSCAHACVADDVTVIADESVALAQLCRSDGRPIIRDSTRTIACDGPSWVCRDALTYRCTDDAPRADSEARCERGCAAVSGVDEILPAEIAHALLCLK